MRIRQKTAEERLPVSAPSAAPAPTTTPTATAANEPDNQKKEERADRDRRDDADAEMDAELRHQPIADERPNPMTRSPMESLINRSENGKL